MTSLHATSHKSGFFDPVSVALANVPLIKTSDWKFGIGSKKSVYLHSEWMADEADYEMSASPRTSFLKRAKRDFEYLLQ